MSINTCRVCGHSFFTQPLLKYEKMPKAAQFFPDAGSIKTEKGVNLEVYQCSGCGLVQLNNEPVGYYKEVVRAAAFSPEMKEFRIKQFKDFVQEFKLSEKKILEVGCGCGEYLSLMQQAGGRTYGLEYSKDSVKKCVESGLKVSQGFIDNHNYKIDNAPFDAFFILNFLEHLPDLTSVLGGIYTNLVDDALGLIEVPNFDMILQKKLFSEFIPDHLFYFTKDTLNTALRINGFEIIKCDVVWYDYIISAVVKKRKRQDITYFYEYQEKLKEGIEQYVCRFKNKKVAVWGAGHQALTVIALTGLRDKIRYVIDSAVFKQGKFTPATHIPIVAPDMLNTEPVDAVIVMAASYSDEVAKIIREKFDKNISIAILRDFGLEEVK